MTSSTEIGRVFDEMSGEYTSIMDQMVPHYRKVITSMVSELPQGFVPANILDLGCGNGNVTAITRVVFPAAHYHLVDASSEMLETCRLRFNDSEIKYENALFQELDLPDDSYDLVLAGFSFHHLEGTEKLDLFHKLNKAIRPGGALACADLFVDKDSPEHEALLAQWHDFSLASGRTEEDWAWLLDHYDKYDRPNAFETQLVWLNKAGFDPVRLTWNDGHWGCFHAFI